jgi:hypothetical protein
MSFFRPNVNGILSEFREMIESSKMLMRVTRKVQYFLEIYKISENLISEILQKFDGIFYFPIIFFIWSLQSTEKSSIQGARYMIGKLPPTPTPPL